MGKINVSKNTVVKSTPETFELIKALFKANGVDSEWPNNKLALQQVSEMDIVGTDEAGMFFVGMFDPRDTEITLQQLAFDSLPAPEWATMIVKYDETRYVWLEHNKKELSTRFKYLDGSLEGESGRTHWWHTDEAVLRKEVKKKDKITEAVRHFNGMWPYGNKKGVIRAVRDVPGIYRDGEYRNWHDNISLGLNTRYWEFVCSREEFEKKAFELGYVKEVKAKQEPGHYRKITGLEPWEIVKRWQESDDLYAHQYASPDGFAKVRHIQQLAQLIHQDKVYEQCSEFDLFVERFEDVTGYQGMDTIRAAFEAGLRFVEDGE